MGDLRINPAEVAAVGSRVTQAASHSTHLGTEVTPVASDPVSAAAAATLGARAKAVSAHSAIASAMTAHRGGQLRADAASYVAVDSSGAAALGGGGTSPAGQPPALPPLPDVSIPAVSAPAIAAPVGDGRAIAELIHTGGTSAGLTSAATWLREHAAELHTSGSALRSAAGDLGANWSSEAGTEAEARIRELGTWYTDHADHARSAAAAIGNHLDSYARAKAAIPTPEQFDDNERRLRMAIQANATPGSLGRYTPIINQLVAERTSLNTKAVQGYVEYAASAGPQLAGDPLTPPPREHGSVQAFSNELPMSPAPKEPPHGKDPRYWIDLDKVIHVGEAQRAPYGTVQIGPGLYYPDPGSSLQPPGGAPSVAKHPLDVADLVTIAPKALGPNGYQQLAPGWWSPDAGGFNAPHPWPAPKQPVDVRDVIQVSPGGLAPTGFIEYLPGWWAPDISDTGAR